MKRSSLLALICLLTTVSHAQMLMSNLPGDTSLYPSYRSRIAVQTMMLQVDSNDFDALYQRATFEFAVRELQATIADLNRAIQIRPQAGSAYSNRGMAYCYMGVHNRAIADLEQAVKLDPGDAMDQLNLAYVLGDSGLYAAAIPHLNEAIRLKPDYAKPFANRGYMYQQLGRYKDALQDYDHALVLVHDYVEVQYNIGDTRLAMKDYKGALIAYNKAMDLFPAMATLPNFYLQRGKALQGLGEKAKAAADFARAKELK